MDETLSIEAYQKQTNVKLKIKIDPDNELFYIHVDNKEICNGDPPALFELFKRALQIWKTKENP